MPIQRERVGYNIIYRVSGPFDTAVAHEFLNLNFKDYYEIGDALGAILDLRQMSRFTIAGLRVVMSRTKGLAFDTPFAVLGTNDSVALVFISNIEALTSRGKTRFKIFRRAEDSLEDALAWVNEWFPKYGIDRDGRSGRITVHPTLPKAKPT